MFAKPVIVAPISPLRFKVDWLQETAGAITSHDTFITFPAGNSVDVTLNSAEKLPAVELLQVMVTFAVWPSVIFVPSVQLSVMVEQLPDVQLTITLLFVDRAVMFVIEEALGSIVKADIERLL
jgi:hypothetical protein